MSLKSLSIHAFILIALAFATGCATYTEGVMLKETPLGISETRKAITMVIGEPKFMSQNGREMKSQYYDSKGRFDDLKNAKSRLFTYVTILGERRPYDIQVIVKVEARHQDGHFEVVSHDDRRAQEQAEKIKKAINESREGRNFIDDFKPF